MTNLSTLLPNKNSSSKKGKLLTQEIFLSGLSGEGSRVEGIAGHLAGERVNSNGGTRGFSYIHQGCERTRGGRLVTLHPQCCGYSLKRF